MELSRIHNGNKVSHFGEIIWTLSASFSKIRAVVNFSLNLETKSWVEHTKTVKNQWLKRLI